MDRDTKNKIISYIDNKGALYYELDNFIKNNTNNYIANKSLLVITILKEI